MFSFALKSLGTLHDFIFFEGSVDSQNVRPFCFSFDFAVAKDLVLMYHYIISVVAVCFMSKDLKDYLSKAGEVTYADAHKDRPNEG